MKPVVDPEWGVDRRLATAIKRCLRVATTIDMSQKDMDKIASAIAILGSECWAMGESTGLDIASGLAREFKRRRRVGRTQNHAAFGK